MFHRIVQLGGHLGLMLLCAAAVAAEPRPPLSPAAIEKSNTMMTNGRWDDAEQELIRLWEGLPEEWGSEEDAELLVQWVCAAERLVAKDPKSPLAPRIMAGYKRAMEAVTGQTRASVANRFAVWQMRDNPRQAVELLRQNAIETGFDDSFAVRFNYARALELSGDKPAALDQYHRALQKSNESTLAAEACLDLMLELGDGRVERAEELTTWLLDRRHTRLGDRALYAFLEQFGPRERLLRDLLRYYVQVRLGVERFRKREALRLHGLVEAQPELGPYVEELQEIYGDGFGSHPIVLFPHIELSNWSEVLQEAAAQEEVAKELALRPLSNLLKMVGDSYVGLARQNPDEAKEYRLEALARYTAAYRLDIGNVAAATLASNLLLDHHQEVDPFYELRERWLNVVFERKTDLMYRAESRQDFENLYYMRLALAEMFARQGEWGPEPRGVLFQLLRAEGNAKTIRDMGGRDFQMAPEVRRDFAVACEKNGFYPSAITQRLVAAQRFAETQRRELAGKELEAADELVDRASDSWTDEHEELKGRVTRILSVPQLRLYARADGLLAVGGVLTGDDQPDRFLVWHGATMKSWDTLSGKMTAVPLEGVDKMRHLALSRYSARIAMCSDNSVLIFDEDGRRRSSVDLEVVPVHAMSIGDAGGTLAVMAGPEYGVTIYGLPDGERLAQWTWRDRVERARGHLAFAANDDYLAVARGGQMMLGRSRAGKPATIALETGAMNCTGSPVEPRFAVRDVGRRVTVLHGDDGRSLWQTEVDASAVEYSADGRDVAVGLKQGGIRLYNADDGKPRADLQLPGGRRFVVHTMVFSRDKRKLATGSPTGGAIWELR